MDDDFGQTKKRGSSSSREGKRAAAKEAAAAAIRQGREPVRVAVVGRPNVGKSTLFNRLIGKRRSITLDTPGVTRDPIVEPVHWDGLDLDLIDTGGIGGEAVMALAERVHEHTVKAISTSDVLVVLLDAKAGMSPLDRETVELVSRSGLPLVYVANKGEGRLGEEGALEFCALGIDPPLVISAEHGQGIHELRVAIEEAAASVLLARGEALEAAAAAEGEAVEDPFTESWDEGGLDEEEDAVATRPCRVAFVGRPNVGKSSFLNLLAGETLSLVDDRPGTTRDVVDTEIERGDRRYILLDTAGMRRPSRVEEGIERISVRRSLDAAERADVVVLMVEPEEGVTDQDARIARHAWEEGRALVILVNKTDLASTAEVAVVERNIRDTYPTLSPVPIGRLSVTKRKGVDEAFVLIDHAYAAHNRRISTPEVNRIIGEAVKRREPPVLGRSRVKFLYATQVAVRPPTIHIFNNRVKVPEDYQRFLERCFREEMDFEGSPLRLRFVRRDSHGEREDRPRADSLPAQVLTRGKANDKAKIAKSVAKKKHAKKKTTKH